VRLQTLLPESVAYYGELFENVCNVLVQAKHLREHLCFVWHVCRYKEDEVLYHCNAQQTHVCGAEDVQVESISGGLESVYECDYLHTNGEQGLLGALWVYAKAAR